MEELTRSVRRVAGNAEASARPPGRGSTPPSKGEQAVRDSLDGMQRIRGEVQGDLQEDQEPRPIARSRSPRSSTPSRTSPRRPTCSRSTPPSRRPARVRRGCASPSSPTRCGSWPSAPAKAAKDIVVPHQGRAGRDAAGGGGHGGGDARGRGRVSSHRRGRRELARDRRHVAKRSAGLAQDISDDHAGAGQGRRAASASPCSRSRAWRVQTEQGVLETRKTMDQTWCGWRRSSPQTLARFKLAA